MKDLEYNAEEDTEFRWWRSCATSEEMASLKINSVSDIAGLTPKLKVLRELERLAMVATEGLDDLRHRLVSYRAGDLWVPLGGLQKEEMIIPPAVTILLIGFTGGGKSSLVNLMYSVLGRAGLTPFSQTSVGSSSNLGPTTMCLEEHNVVRSTRAGFFVYDSMGFDYDDQRGEDLVKLTEWITEGVQHNQLCQRSKDQTDSMNLGWSSKFAKRKVNCVMVVADMSDIYEDLKTGGSKHLEATRQLFYYPVLRKANQNPVLILTHGDKLPANDRIEARLKICQHLGISETSGVYDIVCLTECGVLPEESDPVTTYAVSEVIYRALLISDMSHLPKTNNKDKALFLVSWLLSLISTFFAFISSVFSSQSRKLKRM